MVLKSRKFIGIDFDELSLKFKSRDLFSS